MRSMPALIDAELIAGRRDQTATPDLTDVPPLPPARVTVTRQSPRDVGFREVYVLIDEDEVAVLQCGDAVTLDLDAGPHTIRAHNTLFRKSDDVTLWPGDHVRFAAINRAGWATFGLLGVLGVAPLYLTFERADGAGADSERR